MTEHLLIILHRMQFFYKIYYIKSQYGDKICRVEQSSIRNITPDELLLHIITN